MDKWKSGSLKSGGSGSPVKSQKQAVAIMLSEKRASMKGKKEYRSAMGRAVIHHSPDKHPEQGDPPVKTGMDAILQRADEGKTSGTYGGSRKDMMPAQQPSSKPAQGLMDYIKKFGGK